MLFTRCYIFRIRKSPYFAFITMLTLLLVGCGGSNSSNPSVPPTSTPTPTPSPAPVPAPNGMNITSVPESAPQQFKDNFTRYTKIRVPSGKFIHFYAQDQISDEQIVRTRSILQWYLTNQPGSVYGANKVPVANKMAENGATLILLNGSDNGEPPTDGQPLYQSEIIVEGSPEYMANEPRDAAFEEILHLMHDTGIGVDGPNTFPGVPSDMPFQAALRHATNNAVSVGVDGVPTDAAQLNLWGDQELEYLNELAAENSLTQEYLASMIDVYYGLAGDIGPDTGLYVPKNRAEMAATDTEGWALIGALPRQFFSEYVGYTARIDSAFEGTFTMKFDPATRYTFKSQYLLNAQLTGAQDSNLTGNAQNNRLAGNAGNNILDGGEGDDLALFRGNIDEYRVTVEESQIVVQDNQPNRDGSTTLHNIETMQFADVLAYSESGNQELETEAQVALNNIYQLPITAQGLVSNTATGGTITIQVNFRDVIRLPDGSTRAWSVEEQRPYIASSERWFEVLKHAGTIDNYMLEMNVLVDTFTLGNGAASPQLKYMVSNEGNVFPSQGEFIVNNCLYVEVESPACTEVLTGDERLTEFNANIRHEMGHIFGIGSLWNLDSTENPGEYLGADIGDGTFRNWVNDSSEHQGLIYQQPGGVRAYNAFTASEFGFAPVSDGHLYSDAQNEPAGTREYRGAVLPSLDTELMAHLNLFTPVLFGFLQDLGWVIADSPGPNSP